MRDGGALYNGGGRGAADGGEAERGRASSQGGAGRRRALQGRPTVRPLESAPAGRAGSEGFCSSLWCGATIARLVATTDPDRNSWPASALGLSPRRRRDAVTHESDPSVVESISYPEVDGTFTDDVAGLPKGAQQRHVQDQHDSRAAQGASERDGRHARGARGGSAKAGKFNWQAFGHGDGVGPAVGAEGCARFMRTNCDPALQTQPMAMGVDEGINQSLSGYATAHRLPRLGLGE